MKESRALSNIGIAAKAGKLASGEFSTVKAVRDGKARLVIIAEDASENTRKLFHDKCAYFHVPLYVYGTKEELGRSMGKEARASLAVLDRGLAEAVERQLRLGGGSAYGENEDL